MTLQWMEQCCPAPAACGTVVALKRAWLLGAVLAVRPHWNDGNDWNHETPYAFPLVSCHPTETPIGSNALGNPSGLGGIQR
jgi:hypothetical protein